MSLHVLGKIEMYDVLFTDKFSHRVCCRKEKSVIIRYQKTIVVVGDGITIKNHSLMISIDLIVGLYDTADR